IADTSVNQGTGVLYDTGRMLDLAVEGEGFFRVELPDGSTAYTRNGAFSFNSKGQLVTAQGNPVSMDDFQPLPPGSMLETLSINSLGEVKVKAAAGADELEDGLGALETVDIHYKDVSLGRLHLYNFENPSGLTSLGSNLFVPNEASGDASEGYPEEASLGSLRQGILEGSNVNLVDEMNRLILSQRYFQLNSRSVRLADEMWSLANNIRR
ncbi:MAG: flagellar basal body rod protein FlgG, partial [Firmicutes bacterium HGW-Firmicutes-13]